MCVSGPGTMGSGPAASSRAACRSQDSVRAGPAARGRHEPRTLRAPVAVAAQGRRGTAELRRSYGAQSRPRARPRRARQLAPGPARTPEGAREKAESARRPGAARPRRWAAPRSARVAPAGLTEGWPRVYRCGTCADPSLPWRGARWVPVRFLSGGPFSRLRVHRISVGSATQSGYESGTDRARRRGPSRPAGTAPVPSRYPLRGRRSTPDFLGAHRPRRARRGRSSAGTLREINGPRAFRAWHPRPVTLYLAPRK